jgi:hypothetical protein
VIRLALILLLLATPADAATAVDRMHCWAYPHHERCRPPAPPEPVQAPVVAPPPVLAPAAPPPPQPTPAPLQAPLPTIAPVVVPTPPAPPVAAPAPARAAPVKVKPAKAKKREARKSKRAAPPKAKRAHIGNWCARIPKGTSMSTVEFWAPTFGVKMTRANRAKAQACLNSK